MSATLPDGFVRAELYSPGESTFPTDGDDPVATVEVPADFCGPGRVPVVMGWRTRHFVLTGFRTRKDETSEGHSPVYIYVETPVYHTHCMRAYLDLGDSR